MAEQKHTAGELHIGGDGINELWLAGPDPDANVIADIVPRVSGQSLTEEDRANAERIKVAWNALPKLVAELKRLEWSGSPHIGSYASNCPTCRGVVGHRPECTLFAALAAAAPVEEEQPVAKKSTPAPQVRKTTNLSVTFTRDELERALLVWLEQYGPTFKSRNDVVFSYDLDGQELVSVMVIASIV